ncbi:MAG: DUF2064 domain-containing protein [Acidobacteriaceae bacterium]|jgi:rSAM/selenodomain-associated transferase 1|nr:DUF2064 domain-containing protein [Acidobacteriaceae bacterium]
MTAIAIFVKTPEVSPVKTRLAASIGNVAAQRFYLASAAAVASVVRRCGTALSPYWAVAERETDAWSGFPAIWQGEGDLGERMERVYGELLAAHGSALLIGADIPQVTPALLTAAATAVHAGDAPYVIGPAKDGGFWLVGGRQPVPVAAWRETPYSQANTLDVFTRALRHAGKYTRLDTLTDADSLADVPELLRELADLESPTPEQIALAAWPAS